MPHAFHASASPDVDDCANSRCQNGGSCVDKLNGFECHCAPGFMGERCHSKSFHVPCLPCQTAVLLGPCQDIYKSCEFWEEQDRCDSMRPTTKFFDINCAVTCGQCEFDNSTGKRGLPKPSTGCVVQIHCSEDQHTATAITGTAGLLVGEMDRELIQ